IVVGISLAVLVGFVGLALDGGRLYVTKTELQNAADSCALAAAYELAGAPSIAAEAFAGADAAATTVAQKNRVGFQGDAIASADVTVEFSNALSGGAWLSAGSGPGGDARYVRCTIQRNGITPWFMQLLPAHGPVRAAGLLGTRLRLCRRQLVQHELPGHRRRCQLLGQLPLDRLQPGRPDPRLPGRRRGGAGLLDGRLGAVRPAAAH